MQEELGQEEPRRAQSLLVVQPVPPSLSLGKVWIKWPQACKTTAWEQFDEDVDKVLESLVKGKDWRLHAMTTIITNLAQERFGAEEKRPAWTTYTLNQRDEDPQDPTGAKVPQETI